MFALNRHTIIGRVVKDAALDYVGAGGDIPRAVFSLAVDRPKKEGAETSVTDFISVVAWRKDAEYAAENCLKGRLVFVEGPHHTTTKGEGDAKRTYHEVVVGNIGSSLTLYQPDIAEMAGR